MKRLYIILLLGLTPLLVLEVNGENYFHFKLLVAAFLTLIILVVFTSLEIIGKFKKANNHQKSVIDILLLILVLLASLSTYFSIHPELSIIGTNTAPDGLLPLFLGLAIFYVFYRWMYLDFLSVDCIMILACIVAGIGIWQYFAGADPNTTLGNRNFVGTFSVLFLPVGMGLFVFYKKWQGLGYTAMMLVLLAVSQTRSAYLALIFIMVIMIVLGMGDKKIVLRAIILNILMVIFLAAGTWLLVRVFQDSRLTIRVMRLIQDIIDPLREEAGSERMLIWKNTLSFLWNWPILGSGPDTFGEAYRLATQLPFDYKYQKAHNHSIQMLVTLGWPYFLTYIILVTVIFANLLKRMHRNQNNGWLKIILCILLAYGIQGQFNISVPGNSFIYWALLGLAAQKRARGSDPLPQKTSQGVRPLAPKK